MQQNKFKCEVFLNVYDLIEENYYAHTFGLGAYHTGVELMGVEYSFGHHAYNSTGVFQIEPRTATNCRFRESIVMGVIEKSGFEINQIIRSLEEAFKGNEYHPLTRNCNHFSDEFCRRLVGVGIPSYINRLAWLGTVFNCFVPQSIASFRPGVAGDETTSSSSSTSPNDVVMIPHFSGASRRLGGTRGNDHDDHDDKGAYEITDDEDDEDGSSSSGGGGNVARLQRTPPPEVLRDVLAAASLRRYEAAAAAAVAAAAASTSTSATTSGGSSGSSSMARG